MIAINTAGSELCAKSFRDSTSDIGGALLLTRVLWESPESSSHSVEYSVEHSYSDSSQDDVSIVSFGVGVIFTQFPG